MVEICRDREHNTRTHARMHDARTVISRWRKLHERDTWTQRKRGIRSKSQRNSERRRQPASMR